MSLAHDDVLFLHELPSSQCNVFELLRQPLKDGAVALARSQLTLTFPARFMRVVEMNTCPFRH
jgi:magnesium chelatase family protein